MDKVIQRLVPVVSVDLRLQVMVLQSIAEEMELPAAPVALLIVVVVALRQEQVLMGLTDQMGLVVLVVQLLRVEVMEGLVLKIHPRRVVRWVAVAVPVTKLVSLQGHQAMAAPEVMAR